MEDSSSNVSEKNNKAYSHPLVYSQFKITSQPNMDIFSLWEEEV